MLLIPMRLSLAAQFLIVPMLGLFLLAGVTMVNYWQFERQNALIDEITEKDLQLLDRYAEVFTRFSHHHLDLYNMLYLSKNELDEGQVYDTGRKI